MLRTGMAVGTALVVTCAFCVTPAHAARLTVNGSGFRLATRLGVTSVSPSRQYEVTFASVELKRRYKPHLTAAAAQLRAAGMKMSVGGVERADPPGCPPVGNIHYTEEYRPAGRGGYSLGMPCRHPERGVAAGGVVTMDSEYGDGTWHMAPHRLRNTAVHEMLHALGLDHPNLDLDGDGAASPYECPTGAHGTRPVMCSPNGGYANARAGRLTGFDLAAVDALLANARLQGVS